MANKILWDAAVNSEGNVLTTELDSLADDGVSAPGTEFDNSTNLVTKGWLEFGITFGSAPTSNAAVTIYMLKSLDGTNYESAPILAVRNAEPIAMFGMEATTSARIYNSPMFDLPPSKLKFVAINESGQAFPVSGTTVELFTASKEIQ